MSKVQKLENLILKHKALYYQGRPEITDQEYDNLEEELKGLDPESYTLGLVGTSIKSGSKIRHSTKMLSLDKTYSLEDLKKWIDERSVVSTPKIDGMSGSLIYKDGQLLMAKTRGDGSYGEDITEKVAWMTSVPKTIKEKSDLEIRGEIFCLQENFIIIKKEMEKLGLEVPSSQRNIVAGLISRKENIPLCKHLSFKAFEILSDSLTPKLESEKIAILKKLNFDLPKFEVHENFETVEKEILWVRDFMETGDYLVDGLVFSFNDLALHTSLGETSHHPRYKMAFKFQGEVKKTFIKEVNWNVSRNGVLTPVAKIEPTELSGATISNVTLHNYGVVKEFKLKEGDQIEITRSGEVIPKFLAVIKSRKGEIQLPNKCPSCKGKVEIKDIRIICPNKECPSQVKEGILNFIQKINIDDLSSKRLEEMIKSGLVKKIPDLYKLSFEDLMKLEKTKEKMATKLLSNINKTKKTDLTTLLSSLGLSGGAYNKCEKIVLAGFNTLEKLKKMTHEDLCAIEGFAEKSSTELLNSLNSKWDILDELISLGLELESPKELKSKMAGKTICITGTLSEKRNVIEDRLRKEGAKIVNAVTKKTNYLLTNDPNANSSKLKKAHQLGTTVICEDELKNLIKE
ncbi:NAD-dependent DNA ligase LigA [Bacteriovoracales bacterium]|nr:NAD-dependent DNA ligase LigA [Bacteriovoracales bacterium]